MSNVPEGAPLSEDGYYWWDGTDWQAVDNGSQTDGGGDAGTCVIGFVNVYAGDSDTGFQPRVILDVDDNPDNHHVMHVDAGCLAVWGEGNGGTADCTYSDVWTLDGGSPNSIDNLNLPPGKTTTRSVPLGRLAKGKHTFEVTLNGGAKGSHLDFEVDG